MRTHLDEGVAESFFLQIDRRPSAEDPLVEGNQSIHVGCEECQVMDVSEQLQADLLVESGAPDDLTGCESVR